MEASELLEFKNWAVVEDVLNSSKFAAKILHGLKSSGYNVSGVNPRSKEEGMHKSLGELENKVEVVDLCINPSQGIHVVKEAKDMGIKYVLIQPGAESNEILDFCRDNDIIAIEGCALVELSRKFGGSH